jgi:hypothetical protein
MVLRTQGVPAYRSVLPDGFALGILVHGSSQVQTVK